MLDSADGLAPALRARLRGLRILPRRAMGGHGIGLHASRSRGVGVEFAQYRPYEQGDEPRRIDWKLYARSDRLFVREAERESPLRIWVLLDTSASMAQADEARPAWTRLDAARELALCVVEIALAQGDACGLLLCPAPGAAPVEPAAGPRQRGRLRHALQAVSAAGAWPERAERAPEWARIARGDLVIALGDWFDVAAVDAVERLASTGREVIALQVLTVEEREFPFRDGRRFVDPETGEAVLGDGPALRRDYLARFDAALRMLDARLEGAGIRHARHVLDAAPDAVLRRLFDTRVAGA
ncbi:DUF58 domain-containing protein [Luteimonas deserti]|nr:DUF58 domain-containing protein [Luteimonas deserti]